MSSPSLYFMTFSLFIEFSFIFSTLLFRIITLHNMNYSSQRNILNNSGTQFLSFPTQIADHHVMSGEHKPESVSGIE